MFEWFNKFLGIKPKSAYREQYRHRDLVRRLEALERQNQVYKDQLQRAKLNVQYMKSNYEQAKREKQTALEKVEERDNILQKVVHALAASELARARLAIPEEVDDWSIGELADFVVDVVRKREREMHRRLKEQKELLDEQAELIERLKQDVDALQKSRISALSAEDEDDAAMPVDRRSDEDEADSYDVGEDQVQYDGDEAEDDEEYSREPDRIQQSPLVVENLADLSERLSPEHKTLIEIIGRSGVFRTIELREDARFLESFNQNSNYFSQKLNDLHRMGLLENRSVKTGARGHAYDVFLLTPKGEKVYVALYGKPPVESQLTRLTKRHASPEHAIFVLDTKRALESDGWEVDDTVEGNRVDLPDGKVANFDLTAKRGGEIRRIECERGLQPESDIQEKLDKWLEITPRFFYVSPNKNALDKVKTKFFKWVAARGGRKEMAKKGVCACFITLEDLKKGNEWEEVRFQ